VTCLQSWPLLNTKCDVLGYWRLRSDYYFVLLTTSLVVTTILQCALFISLLILRFSLLLWSWPCVSDRSWFLCSEFASLIGSFDLPGFYSLPPWNRVLAPRIEDILSKGNFSSVVQIVTGITFVTFRCSDNNCSPSRCLTIAVVRLSNVTCIWEPLRSKHHIRHNI
jgi:hypothetical protein